MRRAPFDASARRNVLRAALVAGAALGVLCWSYFTWGVVPLSRMDEPAPSAREPSHLGHVDVLVVDSMDKVVRGHVVADYEGRFAKDPRWEVRLRAVEEEVPKAIRDVREQLGIDDLPVPPLVARFRDDRQIGHKQFMAEATNRMPSASSRARFERRSASRSSATDLSGPTFRIRVTPWGRVRMYQVDPFRYICPRRPSSRLLMRTPVRGPAG